MRASPACQITVCDFAWWRVGVSALVLCVVASAGAWWLASAQRSTWASVSLLMLLLISVWAAVGLMRCPPLSLRWDTARWNLGPAASMGEEASSGQLSVAVDLGAWMLLRFRPDSATKRVSEVWIPVQQAPSYQQWHAFRCAVYLSRPDTRGPATDSLDAAE